MRQPAATLRSTTGTRRRLAVVTFIWANLAMLPCAMAIGGPMHGEAQAGTAHVHHAHNADAADSGSDAPEADCCDLGDAVVAERSASVEKTPDNVFLAAVVDIDTRAAATVGRLHTTTDPPERSRSAPRLHALNCVYLD